LRPLPRHPAVRLSGADRSPLSEHRRHRVAGRDRQMTAPGQPRRHLVPHATPGWARWDRCPADDRSSTRSPRRRTGAGSRCARKRAAVHPYVTRSARASAQGLEQDLATTNGQDRYFLAGLALGAERKGIIPNASRVYGFKIPPVLGGATNVANIHVIDFVVSLHISGQLLRQIRDLPPGTRVSGFTINDG